MATLHDLDKGSMTWRMAKSSTYGYLTVLVCSVYTLDSFGNTSYHARAWKLVHSQGYGISQLVDRKEIVGPVNDSPVNLW